MTSRHGLNISNSTKTTQSRFPSLTDKTLLLQYVKKKLHYFKQKKNYLVSKNHNPMDTHYTGHAQVMEVLLIFALDWTILPTAVQKPEGHLTNYYSRVV